MTLGISTKLDRAAEQVQSCTRTLDFKPLLVCSSLCTRYAASFLKAAACHDSYMARMGAGWPAGLYALCKQRVYACLLLRSVNMAVECAPGRRLHKSPLQWQLCRRLPLGRRQSTGRCNQATDCGRDEPQRDCLRGVRARWRLCHCKVWGAHSALLSTVTGYQGFVQHAAWLPLLYVANSQA